MGAYQSMPLPEHPTVTAPDGSDVRVLLRLAGGSMAHFHLGAGRVSLAVAHRTVEEIWYVVAGTGQMWRRQGEHESIINLSPGLCLSLPLGTHFQFRAEPGVDLQAVAVTMPPWPDENEAYRVAGHWPVP